MIAMIMTGMIDFVVKRRFSIVFIAIPGSVSIFGQQWGVRKRHWNCAADCW
jgi:hypothetical protein